MRPWDIFMNDGEVKTNAITKESIEAGKSKRSTVSSSLNLAKPLSLYIYPKAIIRISLWKRDFGTVRIFLRKDRMDIAENSTAPRRILTRERPQAYFDS